MKTAFPCAPILGDFTIDGNGLIRVKDTAVELLQQGTVTVNGSVDTAADKLDLALAVKTSAPTMRSDNRLQAV